MYPPQTNLNERDKYRGASFASANIATLIPYFWLRLFLSKALTQQR